MTSLHHPIKSTCKNLRFRTRPDVQHTPNTHTTTLSKSPARTINVTTANGISWICTPDPLETGTEEPSNLRLPCSTAAEESASWSIDHRQHKQHHRLRAKSSFTRSGESSGLPHSCTVCNLLGSTNPIFCVADRYTASYPWTTGLSVTRELVGHLLPSGRTSIPAGRNGRPVKPEKQLDLPQHITPPGFCIHTDTACGHSQGSSRALPATSNVPYPGNGRTMSARHLLTCRISPCWRMDGTTTLGSMSLATRFLSTRYLFCELYSSYGIL